MPSTQNDALIQVSAQAQTDLILALRIISHVLSESFTQTNELMGAQLRFNQEPFGFYHNESLKKSEIEGVAEIEEGELKGGSWLLFQKYEQALEPFFSKPEKERVDTMGARLVDTQPNAAKRYPETSHTRVAKGGSNKPLMARRGFSYRENGHEGTAFLAASKSTDFFTQTLNAMLEKDALLNFTNAVEGGIYFIPANGDALFPDAGTPETPSEAHYLYLKSTDGNPIPVMDYTVMASFAAYLDLLRDGGLFEGKIGDQVFNPEVQELLHAVHEVLSGGKLKTPPITTNGNKKNIHNLDKLLNQTLDGANRFNSISGRYMTLG